MSEQKLKMIAKELREFARAAHGNPPTARLTADTLCDYADELERIANGENTSAKNPAALSGQARLEVFKLAAQSSPRWARAIGKPPEGGSG